MKIHHLNCGSFYLIGGVGLFGGQSFFKPQQGIIHCLLIETLEGLVLVDTGVGTRDCLSPSPFMRFMMYISGAVLDINECAVNQVKALGYQAEDVKHIILTHFHYDHAGGLPDFPTAKVHIFKDEYEAVVNPPGFTERNVYRKEHWAHKPHWVIHELGGEQWFGFDSTPMVHLGQLSFCLVPLPGHSPGMCAAALRLEVGWLLNCGDAYTYHGHVDVDDHHDPPYYRLISTFLKVSKIFRDHAKHAPRLRDLIRQHKDQIEIMCSHDLYEFAKFSKD